jgi:hypothetical protein
LADFTFISTGASVIDCHPSAPAVSAALGKAKKPSKRLFSLRANPTGLKAGVNEIVVVKANDI